MPRIIVAGSERGHSHVNLVDLDRVMETVECVTEQQDRQHLYAVVEEKAVGRYTVSKEYAIRHIGHDVIMAQAEIRTTQQEADLHGNEIRNSLRGEVDNQRREFDS